jgi:polysaccharide export outer membrane protein
VVRRQSGSEEHAEIFRATLGELQAGSRKENLALRDGDTIFVLRAESVYVFGEVKSPNAYPVQKDTTVLQALALAGGATEHAALNRIKIVRTEKGKKVEVRAKLTDVVQPGDTIIVPQRYF